jgi:hypothetical protein
MKRVLLTGILSVISVFPTIACTCDYKGYFLEVAPTTKLVALVRVIGYPFFRNLLYYHKVAMEVEVIEIYQGKESEATLIVWGDNGVMCRPYISQFTPSQYYIIGLYPGSKHSFYFESENDYFISSCGEFWLRVQSFGKNPYVISGYREQEKKYTLNQIREVFKKE